MSIFPPIRERVNPQPVGEVSVSLRPLPVREITMDDVRAQCRRDADAYRARQAAGGLGAPVLAARERLRRELVPTLGYYLPASEAARIAVAVINTFLQTPGVAGAEEEELRG